MKQNQNKQNIEKINMHTLASLTLSGAKL